MCIFQDPRTHMTLRHIVCYIFFHPHRERGLVLKLVIDLINTTMNYYFISYCVLLFYYSLLSILFCRNQLFGFESSMLKASTILIFNSLNKQVYQHHQVSNIPTLSHLSALRVRIKGHWYQYQPNPSPVFHSLFFQIYFYPFFIIFISVVLSPSLPLLKAGDEGRWR